MLREKESKQEGILVRPMDKPTDQSHARHPDRIGGIEWNRQTDSLSLSRYCFRNLSGRQGRKRGEITRVTVWPRMPLVVRQICKSSAILRPKFPLSPHARSHTLDNISHLGERGDAIIFVGMGHMSSVRRTRSGMGRLRKSRAGATSQIWASQGPK